VDWTLEVVPVPVSDVDRAKDFYSRQAGFTVDHDTRISDEMRIVQLTPPGSGCSIVIGRGVTQLEPGTLHGLQLVVSDLDAARETLVGNGVDAGKIHHYQKGVPADGRGGPWNSFVRFTDPDGNVWIVQERPKDE
jgi:predicted enzyme related to lactoylglutathione lyase